MEKYIYSIFLEVLELFLIGSYSIWSQSILIYIYSEYLSVECNHMNSRDSLDGMLIFPKLFTDQKHKFKQL